jgi:tRNA pseudouridine-54 N-methylase
MMDILDDQRALDDMVEYLAEHPDQMYIAPNKTSALVYHPPSDAVIYIIGDFSGSEEEQNRELQRRLQELE